jgi:hypothetical protein
METYMKRMDLGALMRRIVHRINRIRVGIGASVHLSIPGNLPEFSWHDCSLEKLMERLIHYAALISDPARPLRIAIHQKKQLLDLEKFFGISATPWIQVRIELEPAEFDAGARQILEDHGYRCEEWIGVEDSIQRLGAFSFGTDKKHPLVLWAENYGRRSKCDLLIPIAGSLPSSS